MPASVDDVCLPHGPIHIFEEEGFFGFTLGDNPVTGEPIYRPGSGVVAGNGTAENPYVIEGWCIATPPSGAAVTIDGTDAHVVIRDNRIPGPHAAGWGIRILDTGSVAIEDNLVTNATIGIEVARGEDITIAGNTVRGHDGIGVQVRNVDDVEISRNEIHANEDGVQVRGTGITVNGNNIHENEKTGLHVLEHDEPLDARGNWWGDASGPSGGHVDVCTDDTAADGQGDQILIGPPLADTRVCFHPWLDAPNPDAGR